MRKRIIIIDEKCEFLQVYNCKILMGAGISRKLPTHMYEEMKKKRKSYITF